MGSEETAGKLTWEDVLKRTDLIGGDIESVEDGVPYRGPLSKIEMDETMVHFFSPWCAYLDLQTGEWKKWNITSCSVIKEILPVDIGGGRVCFSLPLLGPCTLFPKGGSKLDPTKVKGLDLADISSDELSATPAD